MKYILHGGEGDGESGLSALYTEMLRDLDYPITILLMYFAQKGWAWPDRFVRDKELLLKVRDRPDITFILASKQHDVLRWQIKAADVIYMPGGNTRRLKRWLREAADCLALFDGRVIAGSSAGAHVLCKYYYNRQRNSINSGLGILPLKVICHYKEEAGADKVQALANFRESLKVVTIQEGSYVVLEY